MGNSGYIRQAWLVLVLAACFSAALAGVHIALSPRIAANKRDETYRQVPALVPGAVRDRTREVRLAGRTVYEAIGADGRRVGWVVPAAGQGFADRIEVLIGLDAAGETIAGLWVLEQKETPGLGNKIVEDAFRGRFAGRSARADLTVTKAAPATGQQILAVTGATISSESVCKIVNQTVRDFRAARKAAAEAPHGR